MKVSIQIPTYNQAHCIHKAIESALLQTYENIEINVIDDCSTDNTKQVVAKFKNESKVRYICNQSNIGRVANYRKGVFEIATGQLVVNLDGDDYFINNNFIKDAVESISKQGLDDTIMYMAAMKYGNENKEVLYFPNINKEEIVITGKLFFENFFSYNYFTHFGIVANKQFIVSQSKSYSQNISSSDIYTFLNICLHNPSAKIILSKKLSGFWVWGQNNFSQSLSIKDFLANYTKIISVISKSVKVSGIFVYVKWVSLYTFLTFGSYFKKHILKL